MSIGKSGMKIIWSLLIVYIVFGCTQKPKDAVYVSKEPEIFPDYKNVTIPWNIAPLNFKTIEGERLWVEYKTKEGVRLLACGGDKNGIQLPEKKWRKILEQYRDKDVEVKVWEKKSGHSEWLEYSPFYIRIADEPIDNYIAYRLIEPGYELWNEMGIYQRELATFKEKAILTNRLTDHSCMNCHSFQNGANDRFLFHIRQQNKGTVIVDGGNIRKIDMGTDSLIGSGVYPMWHPSGDYIAFSTNTTRQSFHGVGKKRIEVYDLESDLILYDVKKNEVIADKRFLSKEAFETFPAWSPDGKWLYFCKAKPLSMPIEYKKLKYGIYRVGFDAESGLLKDSIKVVVDTLVTRKSALFPRISPDGRFLLYTQADCGTFPIWHEEADLHLIDLENGKEIEAAEINSDQVESYHSWSSNGRWILFSSRRLDGLYTRLFIAYFDRQGQLHRPFLLPQEKTEYYDFLLKSYNIPEFIREEVKVSPYDLEKVIKGQAEPVKVKWKDSLVI